MLSDTLYFTVPLWRAGSSEDATKATGVICWSYMRIRTLHYIEWQDKKDRPQKPRLFD